MARKQKGTTWRSTVSARVERREAFEAMVAEALDSLPEQFGARLENVEVVIEDSPGHDDLLGLYQGIPATERGAGYAGVLPDVITIYRRPIERRARSEEELRREVRITVLHEIAHYFGISDERLHELGWE